MANVINATSTGNGGLVSTGDDSGILNIQTNETTAITVDASQNVGIGNTTPSSYNLNAYKLVIGSNSAVTGITLASGTGAAGNIFFARGATGAEAYDGYIQYAQNGQYMAFGTPQPRANSQPRPMAQPASRKSRGLSSSPTTS